MGVNVLQTILQCSHVEQYNVVRTYCMCAYTCTRTTLYVHVHVYVLVHGTYLYARGHLEKSLKDETSHDGQTTTRCLPDDASAAVTARLSAAPDFSSAPPPPPPPLTLLLLLFETVDETLL